MIECPHCRIGYSPSYENCPKCGEHTTPHEERVRFFCRKAEEFGERNVSRNEIRSFLIENGLSDIEADETADAALGQVRRRNRSHSVLRVAVSLGMTMAGGVVLLVLVLSLAGYIARPKDFDLAHLIIFGLGLTGGGLVLLVRSLWMMTTGR